MKPLAKYTGAISNKKEQINIGQGLEIYVHLDVFAELDRVVRRPLRSSIKELHSFGWTTNANFRHAKSRERQGMRAIRSTVGVVMSLICAMSITQKSARIIPKF